MTQTLKISIGDLLRRRAPRVAAMLPPIAVHALEKRLCVDRLNDYITHHAELPTSAAISSRRTTPSAVWTAWCWPQP